MGEPMLVVAILDDEESVRTALSRLFRSAGFKAQCFASGAEFLNTIPSLMPDCLVVDLHLPVQSGLEVVKQLSKKNVRLATVMITGHDVPGMKEQALASGADEYLVKPIDENVLITAVVTSIRRKAELN
jgi:FixJ family two-component response regulator